MRRRANLTGMPTILLAAGALLSACQSPQDVLEPSALVAEEPPPAVSSPADTALIRPSPEPAQPPRQQAAITTNARVQFPPVIGAPESSSAQLTARLSERAAGRGIGVAAVGDASATLVMRGYFSTILEGGVTTVIYVWDVVDPAGARVHRIQGQTRARGQAAGWDGVDPATIDAVSDQTIDQLATWLSGRQG